MAPGLAVNALISNWHNSKKCFVTVKYFQVLLVQCSLSSNKCMVYNYKVYKSDTQTCNHQVHRHFCIPVIWYTLYVVLILELTSASVCLVSFLRSSLLRCYGLAIISGFRGRYVTQLIFFRSTQAVLACI